MKHQPLLFGALVFVLCLMVTAQSAFACCTCRPIRIATSTYTKAEMERHRTIFFLGTFYRDKVLATLQSLTDQSSATSFQQVKMTGQIADGENITRMALAKQEKTIESHRNFTPPEQACRVGSVMQGMAASEMEGEAVRTTYSAHDLDLNQARKGTSAADGTVEYRRDMLAELKTNNISRREEGGAAIEIAGDAVKDSNHGGDIQGGLGKVTINVNNDGEVSDAERNMRNNLKSLCGAPLPPMSYAQFDLDPGSKAVKLDADRVASGRSLVCGSLQRVMSQMAEGSGMDDQFTQNMPADDGIPPDQARRMMGEVPGSNAQMTSLIWDQGSTERMANLYDNPANVRRDLLNNQNLGNINTRKRQESVQQSNMLLAYLLRQESSAALSGLPPVSKIDDRRGVQ